MNTCFSLAGNGRVSLALRGVAACAALLLCGLASRAQPQSTNLNGNAVEFQFSVSFEVKIQPGTVVVAGYTLALPGGTSNNSNVSLIAQGGAIH